MGLAWALLLLVTAQAGSQDGPNPGRIRELINQFRSNDARKREEAETLLRNMGQAAIPELELAAKDSDPEVASRAGQLIRDYIVRSTLGPELAKAMPGAAQRLVQGDAHTWTEIFLEATDDRSVAFPGIRRSDLDPIVRRAVDGAKTPAEKTTVCERATRWNLMSIEAALPNLLTDPDASVRTGAAYSVSVLRFRRLATNVRPLLGDENPEVRSWAIIALGAVEAKEYAPQLIALLGDPKVRNQAARVLGRWKTKEAVPFIRNLLKAEDAGTRDEGIRAFADLGAQETADEILALALHPSGAHAATGMQVYSQLAGPEGNPKLIAVLRDTKLHPIFRMNAERVLVSLKAAEATPAFVSLLKDRDKALRHYAVSGLLAVGPEAAAPGILPLLDRPQLEECWGALRACQLLDLCGGLEKATALLSHGNWEIREEAVSAVAKLGGPKTADAIAPLLKDPENSVQLRAASALCLLGDRRGAPLLLEQSYTLSALNGLRWRAAWEALRARPAVQVSGDTKRMMEILVMDPKLTLEWPSELSPELSKWAQNGHLILQPGERMDWGTALDLILDGKMDAVLEEHRLRVLPHVEAIRFWKDWLRAAEGK
jgi:HEAT repeat protein